MVTGKAIKKVLYSFFLNNIFRLASIQRWIGVGCFMIIHSVLAQKPVPEFTPETLLLSDSLIINRGSILPVGYEKQAQIALRYFPELKDVKIIFRIKKQFTPLDTRPSLGSIFRKKEKRTYIINISSQSKTFLEPITLKNLQYNAQIGVLGHELSHVADMNRMNFWQLCRLGIGHLSKRFVDQFEFNTDKICIDHGLGYQLLAWSKNVRQNLRISDWQGADNLPPANKKERYMNPVTITNILSTHPLYALKGN